ncbi:Zn-ribbon domain-containing OB-fold protein [Candidatus Bathyarchaeota archaeon]|nr:Zn-ribbon domain-containing OB-fold protein [Candidatus Bathyarchaeota archaeon]
MEKLNSKAEEPPFTIEQFFKFLKEKKLMAAKCIKCGKLYLPPKPICTNCYSKELNWTQLGTKGRLITYTVIHIAPEQFQKNIPYAYGIIELENGLRIPGIIKGIEHEKLKVGTELEVDFETEPSPNWPQWPRYYFKPA